MRHSRRLHAQTDFRPVCAAASSEPLSAAALSVWIFWANRDPGIRLLEPTGSSPGALQRRVHSSQGRPVQGAGPSSLARSARPSGFWWWGLASWKASRLNSQPTRPRATPSPDPPHPPTCSLLACACATPLHILKAPQLRRSRLPFPFPQRSHSFATQLTTTSRARRRVSGAVITISRRMTTSSDSTDSSCAHLHPLGFS